MPFEGEGVSSRRLRHEDVQGPNPRLRDAAPEVSTVCSCLDGIESLAFEKVPREPGLPDDAGQSSGFELRMIRDWYRRRRVALALLHDDVASASTDFLKTVLFEDTADISSRKDAKLTHEPLQSG